jgi:hypothetical protein
VYKVLVIVEDRGGTRRIVLSNKGLNISEENIASLQNVRDCSEMVYLSQWHRGNDSIFNISKKSLSKFDCIIIFNDMDSVSINTDKSLVLRTQDVLDKMNNKIYNNGYSNSDIEDFVNKIVYIPVFDCFETLALNGVRDLIDSRDKEVQNALSNYAIKDKYTDIACYVGSSQHIDMTPQFFYAVLFMSVLYNNYTNAIECGELYTKDMKQFIKGNKNTKDLMRKILQEYDIDIMSNVTKKLNTLSKFNCGIKDFMEIQNVAELGNFITKYKFDARKDGNTYYLSSVGFSLMAKYKLIIEDRQKYDTYVD